MISGTLIHNLLLIAAAIFVIFFILKFIGITIIGPDEVGIVEKWWSLKGSLKPGQIIALNGEAGYQPDLLRGGLHFRTPLQFKVIKKKLVTIPQGKIGYVFSRDGQPLGSGQSLGKDVDCNGFQDVKMFLSNGGQKGPQRGILREGTYAINFAQFIVISEADVLTINSNKIEADEAYKMQGRIKEREGFDGIIIKGFTKTSVESDYKSYGYTDNEDSTQDMMGIVTVHDGPALATDELVAPIVGNDVNSPDTYHNNFQDPEKFLKAGGRKGVQLQVLTDGTYYINRLFASVQYVPKTLIKEGECGVVISYYGAQGEDLSGNDYSHGELVQKGYKGIWEEALLAGKYAFNVQAGKIIKIPINNVILKWIYGEVGSHKLDENLKEITLITKDAFEPSLPLTVVFHIDYRKASRVIQRFGSVKKLIEQSIDPMVAGYFKNIGQTKTLIELIQDRSVIQKLASDEMKEKFANYDLVLDEVLLGTPKPSTNDNRIDSILEQLRDRQVATEQIKTFDAQQKSAEKQKELNEAQARAEAQTDLTQSSIQIEVNNNKGQAELRMAENEGSKIERLAEANRIKLTKEAEAKAYTMKQEAEANNARVKLEAEANAEMVKKNAEAKAYENKQLGESEALKIEVVGKAEADKEARIGISKGIAAQEQVNAFGGASPFVIREVLNKFSEAIRDGKIDLVPKTVITGGSGSNEKNTIPNAFELLATMMLNDKLNLYSDNKTILSDTEGKKIADEIRKAIVSDMHNKNKSEENKNIEDSGK